MSNDTNEPTGARLSEAQVARITARAEAHPIERGHSQFVAQLMLDLAALLADRAAQVAELEGVYRDNESIMMDSFGHLAEIGNLLRDNAAMRPVVVAVANNHASSEDDGMRVVTMPGMLVDQARALVATGVAGQTPVAPEPDGAIIYPPADLREQARIEREMILDSGVDFAEYYAGYAGLVDDENNDGWDDDENNDGWDDDENNDGWDDDENNDGWDDDDVSEPDGQEGSER